MTENKIRIGIYTAQETLSAGKTGDYIYMMISPETLALLGKQKLIIQEPYRNRQYMSGVFLKTIAETGSGEDSRELDRKIAVIRDLALSIHPVGADHGEISPTDIQRALTDLSEKQEIEKADQRKRDEEAAERRRKEEIEQVAQQKALADARELLKDELVAKDTEIERLKKLRDEWHEAATANEEAVRQKIAEDGSFAIEEEHTVTYKVVKEEDCE